MASNNRNWAGVAIFATVLGGVAQAQQIRPAYNYPAAPSSNAGMVQLGQSPFFVAPYLGAAIGRDDNVLLRPDDERSSTVFLVSPGLRADARSNNSVLQFAYQSQAARYSGSRDDDYVDHGLSSQYDIAFSGRSFVRLAYGFARSHDPRGATDRPILDRPDRFREHAPSATFAYGAPGARGRMEFYYSFVDRRYENNRALTVLSDRETNEYGGAFYVRVAPRTYAVAEVRQTEIQYDRRNPADGDERRYMAGVTWEATALTTGTFKVGQLRRQFEDGSDRIKATNWEGIVTWAPRTYSVFDLRTSRHTTESTGLGRFILTSATSLGWNHVWNSRFSTGVTLRHIKDDYEGFDRTDDTTSVGFKVGYRFRRWLTLGAEYAHTRRDSNLPAFDYNKNVYLLTATGSL